MQICLKLAQLGAGSVSPNPMVGSVIVHHDQIIGQGYHQQYGQAHAEVNAINAAINNCNINSKTAVELLKQSTIYVSLEPCAHFGKTPPCADLIIKHQIPKVVVGCRDPFGLVNGKGIEKLIDAGIDVTVGILQDECLELNRRFFTRVQKQRPYVILKWAQTEDGYFAPSSDKNEQRWITGEESRKLVHQWRSEEDAILIGKNTARIDNPQLNVRYGGGRSPKRIVLDRKLELSTHLNIFDQSVETFILNEMNTESSDGNTKYVALNEITSTSILSALHQQGIQSVIIEGGVIVLESFIKNGVWDEARIFTGNVIWESGIKAPHIQGHVIKNDVIGNDILCILRNSAA
jgi:diaminohydroxyphosphoribosylaminopyrimidine deaminase/5-amino-6-(5-phosphoribosylamino)uracil reductase